MQKDQTLADIRKKTESLMNLNEMVHEVAEGDILETLLFGTTGTHLYTKIAMGRENAQVVLWKALEQLEQDPEIKEMLQGIQMVRKLQHSAERQHILNMMKEGK